MGGWQPVLAALFAHGFYFWSDWGQAFDGSSGNGNGFSVWLVALPSFFLPDCKLCAGPDSVICTEPRLQYYSATTSEGKWNPGCSVAVQQPLRENEMKVAVVQHNLSGRFNDSNAQCQKLAVLVCSLV